MDTTDERIITLQALLEQVSKERDAAIKRAEHAEREWAGFRELAGIRGVELDEIGHAAREAIAYSVKVAPEMGDHYAVATFYWERLKKALMPKVLGGGRHG